MKAVRSVSAREQHAGKNTLRYQKNAVFRRQPPLDRAVLPPPRKQRKLEHDHRPLSGGSEHRVQRGFELPGGNTVEHVVSADLDDHAFAALGARRQQRNLTLKGHGGGVGRPRKIGHRDPEQFRPRRALAESTGRERVSDDEDSRRTRPGAACDVIRRLDRADDQNRNESRGAERVSQSPPRAEAGRNVGDRRSEREDRQRRRHRRAAQSGERNGQQREKPGDAARQRMSVEHSRQIGERRGEEKRRRGVQQVAAVDVIEHGAIVTGCSGNGRRAGIYGQYVD